MTMMELPMGDTSQFDPLEKFEGSWNTRLARRYSDLLNELFGKWESVKGRLIVAPHETAENSWGESTLSHLLRNAVPSNRYFVFGCINVALNPDTWIQPDLSILHRVPGTEEDDLFVPATYCTMAIEFASPSSIKGDLTEKPQLLAAAGVPYYMTVQLDRRQRTVRIEQRKLVEGIYHTIASADAGQDFTMNEPFEVSFPASQLLLPRPKD